MQVPYHKPDITLPADLVEEIMRIDGLDNIEIPLQLPSHLRWNLTQKKWLLKKKQPTI
ncbi:MAG: hypothetical protein IPH56_06660 [Chitinophagaceae bacterium]|nr:hypothetical protein [Chitinophagaceae bacterium]